MYVQAFQERLDKVEGLNARLEGEAAERTQTESEVYAAQAECEKLQRDTSRKGDRIKVMQEDMQQLQLQLEGVPELRKELEQEQRANRVCGCLAGLQLPLRPCTFQLHCF